MEIKTKNIHDNSIVYKWEVCRSIEVRVILRKCTILIKKGSDNIIEH